MNHRINNTNITRSIRRIILIALAGLTIAGSATAGPIVDGKLDPAEGYQTGHWVILNVEKAKGTPDNGQLWRHVDAATGDVTVYLSQPLNLIDNTYGKNSIGWGKDVAPSGKNHNFEDLVGSDKAQLAFRNGAGELVLDFTMDYISASGSGYDCLGVTGGDGEVHTGSASSVTAWASSLDYNFNNLGHVLTQDSPLTDDNYTENPTYAGWLWEVAYEFRVAGSTFGPSGYGGMEVVVIHDSPNKIGKNKVYDDINGEIPEPTTLALLAIGVTGLLVRRKGGGCR